MVKFSIYVGKDSAKRAKYKNKIAFIFISEVQPIFETKYQRYKKMENERVKKMKIYGK